MLQQLSNATVEGLLSGWESSERDPLTDKNACPREGSFGDLNLEELGVTDAVHRQLLLSLTASCSRKVNRVVIAEDNGPLIELYKYRGAAVKKRNHASATVLMLKHCQEKQQQERGGKMPDTSWETKIMHAQREVERLNREIEKINR
jgi:hypothetical protein